MLNRTMNERKEQRQSLSNFTKKINREIIETASTLDWTIESIETDNDSRLICPYDPSHQMGKKMLDQHLESCHWKQEGYNEFDVPLPESTLSLDSYSSIKLDSPLQNAILQEAKRIDSTMNIEIYECPTWHKLYLLSKHEFLTLIIGLGERLIPRTSDRIFTDFTCDERKVLYQYVVSNTVKTDIGHDITDTHQVKCQDKEDKKLSFLELLIQERNLKRRRAKHRGVHTNKKSHTEILREVIHQQMELYIDYITETRASNRSTKTSAIAEMQTSEGGNLDDIQTSALSVNQVPLKHHHNLLVEDSQDYSESSSSRNEQKHEYFEKSNASYAKDSERREKSSRKLHKRKRSRSRERDHDKKSKYESSRSSYKKNMKSYETGRTLSSSTYSKRNIDRRSSREKSIL